MSYGIPVIASRIGGIPEVVIENETGILFEPGNKDDLATKIQTLWPDSDLCSRLGITGRKKVQSHNSEELYYKRIMDIYTKAISMKTG